jgi:hypothetical protein
MINTDKYEHILHNVLDMSRIVVLDMSRILNISVRILKFLTV